MIELNDILSGPIAGGRFLIRTSNGSSDSPVEKDFDCMLDLLLALHRYNDTDVIVKEQTDDHSKPILVKEFGKDLTDWVCATSLEELETFYLHLSFANSFSTSVDREHFEFFERQLFEALAKIDAGINLNEEGPVAALKYSHCSPIHLLAVVAQVAKILTLLNAISQPLQRW
jgi:hypothetical protein